MSDLTININGEDVTTSSKSYEPKPYWVPIEGVHYPYPGQQMFDPIGWYEIDRGGFLKGMIIGSTSDIDDGSNIEAHQLVSHIREDLIPTLMKRSNADTIQNDLSEVYEAFPEVKEILHPQIEKSFKGNGKGKGKAILGLIFFIIGLLWGIVFGVLIGRATKKNK